MAVCDILGAAPPLAGHSCSSSRGGGRGGEGRDVRGVSVGNGVGRGRRREGPAVPTATAGHRAAAALPDYRPRAGALRPRRQDRPGRSRRGRHQTEHEAPPRSRSRMRKELVARPCSGRDPAARRVMGARGSRFQLWDPGGLAPALGRKTSRLPFARLIHLGKEAVVILCGSRPGEGVPSASMISPRPWLTSNSEAVLVSSWRPARAWAAGRLTWRPALARASPVGPSWSVGKTDRC